jgi:hypothetical protein
VEHRLRRVHQPTQDGFTEPQDNEQLAIREAISSREQAATGLADVMGAVSRERYAAVLARVEQNLAELRAEAEGAEPGDLV